MQEQRPPLDALLEGLRESLRELAPETLGERMRPVLDDFFDAFELVPKREYDAQLEALSRLEQTVGELEARISELERRREGT